MNLVDSIDNRAGVNVNVKASSARVGRQGCRVIRLRVTTRVSVVSFRMKVGLVSEMDLALNVELSVLTERGE